MLAFPAPNGEAGTHPSWVTPTIRSAGLIRIRFTFSRACWRHRSNLERPAHRYEGVRMYRQEKNSFPKEVACPHVRSLLR